MTHAQSRAKITRRGLLGAGAAALPLAAPHVRAAHAADLRIGVLLPYSGVFASLGNKVTQGMELAVEQAGGTLGGRKVDWRKLDSEADPSKAPERMARLLRQRCDIIIGPVHSGVALGMIRVLQGNDNILIIPNAGAAAATGELCAFNIFRTAFTNWQPAWPMGRLLARRGLRRMASVSWSYAAGTESVAGFREGFESGGGEVVREILAPFPTVEFQSYLPELATSGAEAVYAFFSGAAAVQFVKQYHEAGLRERIPLYGVGFLTEGTLDAQGRAAEGLETTMHYADDLPLEANHAFRAAFSKAYDLPPDVYSVQGYDTGKLLVHGLARTNGETGDKKALARAFASFSADDSPRGPWRFSAAQNPVQTIYLRRAEGGFNRYVEVAEADVEDPAVGCSL